MIVEGVITTIDGNGKVNVAPMGPRFLAEDFGTFLLRPYRTSRTYRNLREVPEGVFHITDDVDLIARSVIGDVQPPMRPAANVRGQVLTGACRYHEFRVEELDDRQERTSIRVRSVATGRLRDFLGFNRARHAVIEAAILASRIDILPREEILAGFRRLEDLVDRAGGVTERQAFDRLAEHVGFTTGTVTSVRVSTGSRLHFGLLAPWSDARRRHGGIGMMIAGPATAVTVEAAPTNLISGPFAQRVADIVERSAAARGTEAGKGFDITVHSTTREHAGLGCGTQVSLAVARAIAEVHGTRALPATELARLTGRGRRSAIGIHGFDHGGLIVDGGHGDHGGRGENDVDCTTTAAPAPLLARLAVPETWSVVIAIPGGQCGLTGMKELDAFGRLDSSGRAEEHHDRSAEICHDILLALLPAVSGGDFQSFSRALWELGQKVGEIFAPVQGGLFATSAVETVVGFLRAEGVEGAGQSSWGPTVFGLVDDRDRALAIATRLGERFGLAGNDVLVTTPLNRGASIERTVD